MRVCFYTLGCKVNQNETGALAQLFEQNGFTVVEEKDGADVYVVNSCTVTNFGDQKSRKWLRRAKRENPGAVTVLTGCYPQAFPEEAAKIEEADVVTGSGNRHAILQDVQKVLNGEETKVVDIRPHQKGESFEELPMDRFADHTRAFVKVEDGCNRRCAYCVIPRAKELGMQSTTFRNACGLDEDGHLSTARDVAIMSREMLLNHPEIENYCTVWMDTLRGGATQLVNTNKLLKSYNGITGLKTGTTGKAGVCISASASRDDLRLIAVVLGSSSGKERFAAATSLLDYGFAMFESALVPIPADAPKTLPVQKGEEPVLELCYTAPERCLAVKGQGSTLQAEVELPQTLEAPIREGSVIGSLNIKNSQGILQSCPIIAAKPVDARSFSGCFRRVVNALWLTA